MLAGILGARPALIPVSETVLAAHGLEAREISPFSGKWMSRLDPTRARTELGFRHEPLEDYLGKIVASFLAHPPGSPTDDYRHRPMELQIAAGTH
jgi:hypothetical protein